MAKAINIVVFAGCGDLRVQGERAVPGLGGEHVDNVQRVSAGAC